MEAEEEAEEGEEEGVEGRETETVSRRANSQPALEH